MQFARLGVIAVAVVSSVTVVATSGVASPPAVPMSAGHKSSDYVPANVRVALAVKDFYAANVEVNYVGLNEAIVRAGGSPVRFSVTGSGRSDLSPQEAQAVSEATKRKSAAAASAAMAASSAPAVVAPTVNGWWSYSQDQYGEWWTWFGSWDFPLTSYIERGGGKPEDAFALNAEQINLNCWAKSNSDLWTTQVGGAGQSMSWSTGYRRMVDASAVLARSVWAVDDTADSYGDPFYPDYSLIHVMRGLGYLSFQNIGGCASSIIYGRTFYEHNVGGCNCSWSAQITAGVLSIGYTGTQPEEKRQVSTDAVGVSTGNTCACSGGGGGGGGGGGIGQPPSAAYAQVFEAASDRGWTNMPVSGASGSVAASAIAAIDYGGTKLLYTVKDGNVYEASSADSWRNLPTGISQVNGSALAAISVNGVKYIYTVKNGEVFEASSANGWANLYTGISGVSNSALAAISVNGVKYIYNIKNGVVYEAASDRGWNNLKVSGSSDEVRAKSIAAINNAGVKNIYSR